MQDRGFTRTTPNGLHAVWFGHQQLPSGDSQEYTKELGLPGLFALRYVGTYADTRAIRQLRAGVSQAF